MARDDAPARRVVRSAASRQGRSQPGMVQQTQRGTRTTSTSFNKRPDLDSEQQEQLDEVTFPPGVEPARVHVGAGTTRKLGDFESMRMDVSVTLPCMPTPEGIEAAYIQASDFCAIKLEEELNQWMPQRATRPASQRR